MKVKIIRAYLGNLPLQFRIYEALRRQGFQGSGQEWNQHGRRYSIKGLYNLLKTSGIEAVFEDSIKSDLTAYEEDIAGRHRA